MTSKTWKAKDVAAYSSSDDVIEHLRHAFYNHVDCSESSVQKRADKGEDDASIFFRSKEDVILIARRMIKGNAWPIAEWLNDHHDKAPEAYQIVGKARNATGRTYFSSKESVVDHRYVLTLKKCEDGSPRISTFFPVPDDYVIDDQEKIKEYEETAEWRKQKAMKNKDGK